MTPLPALPDRIRQAREVRLYRAALERDAQLFDRWADSMGNVRAGQAAYMRLRAAELREILNAAPSRSDVPAGTGAAESPR
jgi:hypothetical protein